MMDRDSKTRTGARAPGVEQQVCSHGGAQAQQLPRHRAGMYRLESGEHEGRMQTRRGRDNWAPRTGQAPFDKPALKPYWGKPTVRNFRGGGGNVGIIRSPNRATALPDPYQSPRNGHVAIPHPGAGNRPGDAWCKRPGGPAPMSVAVGAIWGPSERGSLKRSE